MLHDFLKEFIAQSDDVLEPFFQSAMIGGTVVPVPGFAKEIKTRPLHYIGLAVIA